MLIFNLLNASIQGLVPDELRGRVVSLYNLSFFGLITLGALLVGWVADAISEPTTLILSAVICLGFAAWVWFRAPEVRAVQ